MCEHTARRQNLPTNQEEGLHQEQLAGTLTSTAGAERLLVFLAAVPGAWNSARHRGDPPVRMCRTTRTDFASL